MEGPCDSCGREDDVAPVIRVYIVRRDDGTEAVEEADDELWCASCRATYPHRERC
ncbi:MAG: hypothetical protein IT195_07875 [Microthrixaceae bacterium]|nr:hypothetical protein [Microthrixaceae bacterium]